jgi:hypothetical protein
VVYGPTHHTGTHRPEVTLHLVGWTIALLGLLAAAVGAYIELAPADGTINVFTRTWAVSDVSAWAPGLLLIGGAVAAVAMSMVMGRDMDDDANGWTVGLEGAIAIVGVAALVAGIVLVV